MRKSSRGNPYHDERGRFASADAHKVSVINSNEYYEERTKSRMEEQAEKEKFERLEKHSEISKTEKFVAYTDGEVVVYGDGTSIDFEEAQSCGYSMYEEYSPEYIGAGKYTITGGDSYAEGCCNSAKINVKEDGTIYCADGVADRSDCEYIGTFRGEIELDGYCYYGDVINVHQKGNDIYIDTIDRSHLQDVDEIDIETEGDWSGVEYIYHNKVDVDKYYKTKKQAS